MSMNDPNRELGNPIGSADDGPLWTWIVGILAIIVIFGGLIWAGKSNHSRTASQSPPISHSATTGGGTVGLGSHK